MKEGLDVTAPDHKGRSPAHVAAHKNQVGAIAVLAEAHRLSSPRTGESGGGYNTHPPLDLNARDENGESPLHHAVMAKNMEAVSFLCDAAGVDVDAANALGMTPCWQAMVKGEVGDCLLE